MNEPPRQSELLHFRPHHAPLVAAWVRDDEELFWLAPQTPPPATAEKVAEWTAKRGRPVLCHAADWPEPFGYAELNDLPSRDGELWIGHFIVDPDRRARGLGREMMQLLLARAFGLLHARRVALIVFPDNAPAIRCYRAAGLVVSGTQDKTFPTRPGPHPMTEMAIDRSAYRALHGLAGPSVPDV